MNNDLTVPQWSALPSLLPPERTEYNKLRGRFAVLSRASMDAFSRDYDAQIGDLDELVEKASDLANPHIGAAIDAAIKLLVERRVFDIDKDHFTEHYWHPYDTWTPAFEHVADQLAEIVHSAEELDAYRTARRQGRGRIIGGGFGLGGAVKGMAAAGAANLAIGATHAVFNLAAKGVSAIGDSLEKSRIFDDAQTKRGLVDALGKSVLAVHLAVLDALAAAKADAGLQRIPAVDEEKAQRMLANLRQGMLGDAEAGAVLTEILTRNPYLLDAYTHALDAAGDASGELERVAAFFHLDLAGEKKARIRRLIRTGDEKAMRESIRQVNEAGQRLGIAVEDEFLEPLNQRLAKVDLIARTVEGTVYPTREEAQAAAARLKAERAEKVREVLGKAKRGSIRVVKIVGYTSAALVVLFIVLAIVVPPAEKAGTAESTAVAGAPADSSTPAAPPAESASQGGSTESTAVAAAPADTAAPAPDAATTEPPAAPPAESALSDSQRLGDPVREMLVAAGEDERVEQLAALIENLPQVPGDRARARQLNDQALPLLRQGDLTTAIDILQQAVAADPSDAEVLNNLAYAQLQMNDVAGAADALHRTLRLAPRRSAAWLNLGEAYASSSDTENAARAFQLAYRFSTNPPRTLKYLERQLAKAASPAADAARVALAAIPASARQ